MVRRNSRRHGAGEGGASNDQEHRTNERKFWSRQLIAAWCLNGITFAAAAAAIWSLIYLARGVSDNRDAMEETNRAWLAPVWGQAKYAAPDFIVSVKIVNFGKEPAFDLNLSSKTAKFVDIHTGEALQNVVWPANDECVGVEPKKHGPVAWPLPFESDENFRQDSAFPGTDPSVRTNLQGVQDGTVGLIVYGCIAYVSFKKVHHSQYCFLERRWLDGHMGATACEQGAYAD